MTIPGWTITEDDGLLIAVRQGKLTEYQRRYGAIDEVDARDEGELWILCDAQTRLAERLGTAEDAAPKVKHLHKVIDLGWTEVS
jgi:hypothetical protein